jgi:hypothetical protein
MRLLRGCVLVLPIAVVWFVNGAETAHAGRTAEGALEFHYGVLSPEVVLAYVDATAHTPPPPGERHLVVAVLDRNTRTRVTHADVSVTVQHGTGDAVTRRLEPMKVVDQQSYRGFFGLSAQGIYQIPFEARRPEAATIAAGEFEYHVSPKGRGR